MKPETSKALEKAKKCLQEARMTLHIDLYEQSARISYLSVFDAAQAYIYEKTGQVAKTHNGVRSEFARLAKNDPSIEKTRTSFLAQAYEFKTIADYGVEPEQMVGNQDAEQAVKAAEQFILNIEKSC